MKITPTTVTIKSVKEFAQIAKKELGNEELKALRKDPHFKQSLKAADALFKQGFKLESERTSMGGHLVKLTNKEGPLMHKVCNSITECKLIGSSVFKGAQNLFVQLSGKNITQGASKTKIKLPNLKG